MAPRRFLLPFLLFLIVSPPMVSGEEKTKTIKYEDDSILVRIIRRSPKQLAAFYEGRGFEKTAIDKIKQTCGIAVIIKNKTRDILWLELDNWQFYTTNEKRESTLHKPIQRIARKYWRDEWKKLDISSAHRSTFGWTLMPEVRDLRPEEGVGGNVTLPFMSEAFTMVAKFHTGKSKQGNEKTVTLDNITCLSDEDTK